MREETGLTVRPRLVGVKQFPIAGGRYLVFLFRAVSYSGEVCSSDEGEMRWIPRDRLADFATVDDLAELISVFDSPELTEFRYVERDGGFAVELS